MEFRSQQTSHLGVPLRIKRQVTHEEQVDGMPPSIARQSCFHHLPWSHDEDALLKGRGSGYNVGPPNVMFVGGSVGLKTRICWNAPPKGIARLRALFTTDVSVSGTPL